MKNYIANKKKSIVLATSFILISMVLIPLVTSEMVEISGDRIFEIDEDFIDKGSFASHHKVLIEFATSTNCPFCPDQSNFLWGGLSGDFMVITMGCSHYTATAGYTPDISARLIELGQGGLGYPTSWFDGGYTRVTGGGGGAPAALQNAYNVCQSRTVADVDITLFPVWRSDDTLDVTVYVDNTGSSTYNGHIHVYVLEKTSRWYSYSGPPYQDLFLQYAMNQDITVSAGDTWIGEADGWSFPDTTSYNTLVVASVFTRSTMDTDETEIAEPGGGGDDDDDDDDDYNPPIPIPKTKISEPGLGDIINGTVTITGTSHHPEGDQKIKWTLVKIDDGGWVETDDPIYWSYEWDTTTVEDGEHILSAVCSDGIKQSAIYQTSVDVKNDEDEPDPEKIPDLTGEGTIGWSGIKPKLVIQGEFTIENVGDAESELDWEIGDTPDWGDWTFMPSEGYDLTPEDGEFTVDVLLVAPDETNQEFTGEIKVVNSDDGSDYITVPVSLTTPKFKGEIFSLLLQFLDQHPRILPILKILIGL